MPISALTSWKDLFAAALRESDVQRLPERIQQAQDAILDRVDQLLDDPDRQPEHDEILFALNRLNWLSEFGRGDTYIGEAEHCPVTLHEKLRVAGLAKR
jgi:hypothetical protein